MKWKHILENEILNILRAVVAAGTAAVVVPGKRLNVGAVVVVVGAANENVGAATDLVTPKPNDVAGVVVAAAVVVAPGNNEVVGAAKK